MNKFSNLKLHRRIYSHCQIEDVIVVLVTITSDTTGFFAKITMIHNKNPLDQKKYMHAV